MLLALLRRHKVMMQFFLPGRDDVGLYCCGGTMQLYIAAQLQCLERRCGAAVCHEIVAVFTVKIALKHRGNGQHIFTPPQCADTSLRCRSVQDTVTVLQ